MLSASYPVRSDSTDPGANDDVRLSANDVKLMGQVGCGGFATSFLAELQRGTLGFPKPHNCRGPVIVLG